MLQSDIGLDRWIPLRPAHKDDEISGEVLVALRLEKVFTATDPATEKVCDTYSTVFTSLFEAHKSTSFSEIYCIQYPQ